MSMVKKKRVTFRLDAPVAREVYLVSNFNIWNPSAHPMTKEFDGTWKKTLMLPEGTYEYRFVVDGSWHADPACIERVRNDFGTSNCILRV